MNSTKIVIILLISTILTSCNHKNTTNDSYDIIKIDPYESKEFVNLSEIADSIKCIKLQTDSNQIMGRVREIIIKKKYIYAFDISQSIIFVFDKNGKFISKLDKKGQGPDEYNALGPIFIDDNEKFLEIIDYKGEKTSKLKYSNIDFKLINKTPFPEIHCNSCKRHDSLYYFATQQIDNNIDGHKTNAGLIISNDNMKLQKEFDKIIETERSSFSPNIESFTQNDKNELFVSLMYDNSFYKLEAGRIIPILGVDFREYNMNNSIGSESLEAQLKYIKETDGIATFPVLNIHNTDITAFSYYFKQDKRERMYREEDFRQYIKTKNKKVFHVKKIKNDLTNFPSHIYLSSYFFSCAHEVWYENYLVDVIIPHYYFSNNETDKINVDGIGEITAYDNPVIVLMKLK